MKKLLVLAALSAMAMGAKAEYYSSTVSVPDAGVVYLPLRPRGLPGDIVYYQDTSREAVLGDWESDIKPVLFNADTFDETFETKFTSWADRYAFLDEFWKEPDSTSGRQEWIFTKTSDGEFSNNGVQFNNVEPEAENVAWGLLVLKEDALTSDAEYYVYYGTSAQGTGGEITVDFDNPLDHGFLMTDGSPTPAPEPTSGLLLLLGVAGLALKRKRA